MGRKRTYAPLDVFMNRRKVGQFFREPDGAFAFTYAPEWLAWENTLPVSRSLPLRSERYVGPPVIAVFDNLLPDNDDIRRRVAERIGADGLDAYSLLAKIGRDCVGALQFLPEGEEPEASDELTGEPLSDEQIAAMLKDLKRTPLGIRRESDFRISVAGAQEKTALLYHEGKWIEPTGTTATTHIFKPAIGKLPNGMDLTDSIENEHFCLRLMAAFGLPVAQTEIATFADTKVLVIERFDRLRARDGRLIRLPQEDCCQALSIPPTRKYQNEGGPGIVEICDLLQGSDEPLRDRANFFKANVLFWLIGATDGHAKNFSIALTPGGRFTMTPLYDVLTVQPTLDAGQLQSKEMKLAMRIGKSRHYKVSDILGRHFMETGLAAGFSREQIGQIFKDIEAESEKAFAKALAEMPTGFPMGLFESVRRGFDQRVTRLAVSE
ncbi:type II toxin-antitoxin system HipA family toxin [Roseovarius nubinhibens]|uniref:HipA protein n=1 Tax=Roseovarius nubinhibens (strain ATCC BAA-591 / DSM 15170 / ISM) TaxID=89187 RepID=A3SLC5_ROSNI|nr:type II toxin-antitoxin system HipA family toxin [Roseovarius nubinhibens]EAP78156.1 HipA protein [Roseovarius nubinhibens ISM]|tara:strand:- start:1024 stop:2334 length:1311 start_codon:yes stop_codon:yes gene_type:complete